MKRILVVVAVALSLVSGCSEEGKRETLHTVDPATPAASPEISDQPAGSVDKAVRGVSTLLFEPATKRLVMLTDGAVVVGDLRVDGARGLFAGGPGQILVTSGTGVDRIDVASGRKLVHYPAGVDTLSAIDLPDGRVAVGTADGQVVVFDGEDIVSRTSGFASVDSLVVVGDSLVALDRQQSMLAEVNIEDERHGLALRTGQGAGELATDHWDRILVTDPRTKELTVFSADPLIMRQRFPTGSAPFAVAYDDTREIAWVTLTETNEVVGYDLSTGTAREVHRYPTVRQPNAIAIDPATGDLVIAGEGLQRIPV